MRTLLLILIASFFIAGEAFAVKYHTPPAARDEHYSANPTHHQPDAILSPKPEEAEPQDDSTMDEEGGTDESDAPTTDVEEEAEPQQQ
jgi:hypothetical protein